LIVRNINLFQFVWQEIHIKAKICKANFINEKQDKVFHIRASH